MPVNTARNELLGITNAPDPGESGNPVRVRAGSETFFGLDSVMVVECVVSELAQRDNIAGLMIILPKETPLLTSAFDPPGALRL